MGFFTWTLANKKTQTRKDGDFKASCLLRYYGYGAILCPDNTLIKESCYEGYGMFGGKDVYDLVVDWNRDYLKTIPNTPGFKEWDCGQISNICKEIAAAYQEKDDEKLQSIIHRIPDGAGFFREEWKRELGIWIACENNHLIPFPIKIVDLKRPADYTKFPPSISTQ